MNTALKHFVIVALSFSLTACKLGFDQAEECEGDDCPTEPDTVSFFGPNSNNDGMWTLDLDNDESTFTLKLYSSPNDKVNEEDEEWYLKGTFEEDTSQFDIYTVTESSDGSPINKDDDFAVVNASNRIIYFIDPANKNGFTQALVVSGFCNTSPFTSSWTAIGKPRLKDTLIDENVFLGQYDFSANPQTLTFATQYNLKKTEGITSQPSEAYASEASCKEGLIIEENSIQYLSTNNTSIVRSTTTDRQETLLIQRSVAGSFTGDNYIGFAYDASSNSSEALKATCDIADGCVISKIDFIDDGTTDTEWVNIKNVSSGVPEQGFYTGKVEYIDDEDSSTDAQPTGNVLCSSNSNFANTGSKMLNCLSQEPDNNSRFMSFVLFAPAS